MNKLKGKVDTLGLTYQESGVVYVRGVNSQRITPHVPTVWVNTVVSLLGHVKLRHQHNIQLGQCRLEAAAMGASDSKLVFKQGIFKLSEDKNIPANDPYWTGVC